MTIRLEVAGVQYESFVSASVEIRLDSMSNRFTFSTSSEDAAPLPFLGGEECRVFVDGEQVTRGFVEKVDGSGDESSHEVTIQGRDRTADLLDSTIGSLSDLRPPISLKEIVERVISHVGSPIRVVDLSGVSDFNSAEDLAAPEPGAPAFDFVESLARKRQVLLTSDRDGNVVITRSSGVRTGASLVHRPNSSRNNVVSYSFSYDLSDRFRRYLSLSQLNVVPTIETGSLDAASVANQSPDPVVDSAIREGRQLAFASESMYSEGEGSNRATWEANVRKARSRVYSAVVDGFRDQDGNLWDANRLVRVDDPYAGIDSVMLVNSVSFSLTETGGSTTALSLVNRDAYTLALQEPREQEVGSGLSLA